MAFQDGIHPGGEFIKEKHGRVNHEDFGDLHATAKTSAQVLHLAVHFRAKLKFFDQRTRAASRHRFVQSLEPGVGEQIVFDG